MRVVENGAASGGAVLQADGAGRSAFSFAFDGPSGLYRIAVDHFDEADGASRMAVEVGGARVDAWVWDAELGHDWAVAQTRATHETGLVELVDGDTIRFVGEADGGEPLRVDAVRLERAGPAPAPAPAPWRIEAEDMDLVNLRVNANPTASGERLVRIAGPGEGEASFRFGGVAGRYDVEIAHFDERDGVSRMSLEVDGAVVGSWDWDQRLDGGWADAATLTSHRFEGVSLREDSRVRLVGEADRGEPLRFDAVSFLPDADLLLG